VDDCSTKEKKSEVKRNGDDGEVNKLIGGSEERAEGR
jgi:hypothetical protein